jgi:hypothetical protein
MVELDNSYLTTPHTTQQWLSAQQAKNKLHDYSIVTEDLDNNPLRCYYRSLPNKESSAANETDNEKSWNNEIV